MGYDLSNATGGYVRFSGSSWDLTLAVARHYGWEPAGIPAPAGWDEAAHGLWEDEYWINAGQQVTASDAAAMTAALDLALGSADLLDVIQSLYAELTKSTVAQMPQTATNLRGFGRDDAVTFRGRLAELAAFTRAGPFTIE